MADNFSQYRGIRYTRPCSFPVVEFLRREAISQMMVFVKNQRRTPPRRLNGRGGFEWRTRLAITVENGF